MRHKSGFSFDSSGMFVAEKSAKSDLFRIPTFELIMSARRSATDQASRKSAKQATHLETPQRAGLLISALNSELFAARLTHQVKRPDA